MEIHAPLTFAALAPPAGDEDLRAVRDDVGQDLPDDLVTWWRLCNGTGLPDGNGLLLPPFFEPCSLRDVLVQRSIWVGSGAPTAIRNATVGEAGSPAGAFLTSFIPIAADGGGDMLFVDLRSGPRHGCVQHWSGEDGTYNGPWWTGVADMLADVANALHTGSEARRRYVDAARERHIHTSTDQAVVSDGRLFWESAPDDLPRCDR
ncbi:cell wall assembly regulator SMI1 [Saccharothrix tamanrassetensis]|uniref:Cell wall assembly regulator SMI1 n=1 Tax=Saccharothrix tamanrassetensis TaxID=1051531 RepID=A0A841CV54_9PSEU|nr:cell wall assembly regulator SMI1 [Saccharothrix tamanrassetensis]